MSTGGERRYSCWYAPAFALAGLAVASGAARAQEDLGFAHGLSYLAAFGTKNYSVVTLLYGVMIISLVVMTIVGVLVLAGALLNRTPPPAGGLEQLPPRRSPSGLWFIYAGLIPSFLVLLATAVWNYVVLADVAEPHQSPGVTIDVVGHQWWWEVHYHDNDASREFTTANEIHIPVNQPVKVELGTADVIHSFWVPALSGKTDTIPGQHNVTWIEADQAGVYRGQCTEYCGHEHAYMGFLVVAQPVQEFKSWWSRQLEGPRFPDSESAISAAKAGQAVFMRHCAVCHGILGTPAGGRVGPDLSHLMARKTIAAGTLPNTAGYLSAWISDPQHVKPGNLMPTVMISPAELSQLTAFLRTLE